MITCFLCQKNNFIPRYYLQDKNIIECNNDRLFFAKTTKSYPSLYGKKYFENNPYPAFYYQQYFQDKINLIKKLTNKSRPNILDVGCGWGHFLKQLKINKLNYKGIDTSIEAIKICRSNNLNCTRTTIESLAEKEKSRYDAVISFQTIEHLTNPAVFLQSINKLLKKDGVILLTTPNNDSPLRYIFGSRWSVYNTDSHMVFYNKKNLSKTLKKRGFKNIQVNIDRWRMMSLGYILSRLKLPFLNRLTLPIPTDPLGDLMATGFKK